MWKEGKKYLENIKQEYVCRAPEFLSTCQAEIKRDRKAFVTPESTRGDCLERASEQNTQAASSARWTRNENRADF